MRQILLVDDNALQLHMREAVLRSAGFAVSMATTAESAIALLRVEPLASSIGLIITDHLLPGASGSELVRQVRTINPHVPVLVVTGLADAEDEYAGMNITFRRKPCPPTELIATVMRLFSYAA